MRLLAASRTKRPFRHTDDVSRSLISHHWPQALNGKMMKSQINPRVFWGASAIIAALLATTLAMPGTADSAFKAAQS
jgi:hypothetical protein